VAAPTHFPHRRQNRTSILSSRHDIGCDNIYMLNIEHTSFHELSCLVSQPTLRQEGDVRLTGASSKEGKHTESPPTFIWGVVFTHGEGISTPCVRHKGRQPLIKCANMTSICFIFPFLRFLCLFVPFVFFILLWSTRVFPLLLRIPQSW